MRFSAKLTTTSRLTAAGLVVCGVFLGGMGSSQSAETPASTKAASPKKVVLIAGPKSHGPVGNGIHDYPWSVKLLKVMLDNSNVHNQIRVEYHLEGWPEDPTTLDDADAIMVISDGRDGDKYAEAPHFQSQAHRDAIAKQIERGCGFLTFHFSTFAPDQFAEQILDWSGGYFDWETDGKREWYSAIKTLETKVELASPSHPISRGLHPFQTKEEFYYNIRFPPNDPTLSPIWNVPALDGRDGDGNVMAWAKQRANGGRGFGTTAGHFYDNWRNVDFRTMILNAIVWTAGGEVPTDGVQARYYSHQEITAALAGVTGTATANVDDQPIKALILTGAQHPAHKWQETTPAIRAELERDPRIKVDVSERIEDLATDKIHNYDLLVVNYCNWKLPGLSDAAKAGFLKYLDNGGGLVLVHFANGAFHHSLPETEDSDWPEYRNICRRVWDHSVSGHDKYGKFIVEIEDTQHPISQGAEAFETTDELYFRQAGEGPIHVLAKARSQVTGEFEPMAFVYEHRRARVFQTVLGHAAVSINTPGAADLLRRGTAWVARREQWPRAALKPAQQPADAVEKQQSSIAPGRFNKALDARAGGVLVAGKPAYREPSLTVECWAKLDSKRGFNILIASEHKSSPTHWEMYTYANSGEFSVFLPGQGGEFKSGVNVCDGKWHHLALVLEPQRIRLFVDARQTLDRPLEKGQTKTTDAGLAFGQLVEGTIGCDGLLDDVRVSKGVRIPKALPLMPHKSDDTTVHIWSFDTPMPRAGPAKLSSRDAQPQPTRGGAPDHFGRTVVGFDWTENDSRDGRWQQTDVGRFLASIAPVGKHPVRKGLSIRLGDEQQATVCFDTENLQCRVGWTGGFLRFDPQRYGIIAAPQIAGDIQFLSQPYSGWTADDVQYRGLYQHGQRVVLSYLVDNVAVLESPWIESTPHESIFTRTLEIDANAAPLEMNVYQPPEPGNWQLLSDLQLAVFNTGEKLFVVAVMSEAGTELKLQQDNRLALRFEPRSQSRRVKLCSWSGPQSHLDTFTTAVKRSPPPQDLQTLVQPTAPIWTAPIITQGQLGNNQDAYAVDTLTLPFENPYNALFFVSGHDFFANGDAAICTLHGDVWLVSGLDNSLKRLVWRRFATGLFQPLGLRIIDDAVYVLGRDQITRLHDRNSDGEADFYENFNNDGATSPGGHDYVTCLETDSQHNFYYLHAQQGLVRVSHDGRQWESLAGGLRNPNGLSVGPDDVITVSPQEGNWTPASCIFEVTPGGYYGYGGPQINEQRPLGYDPPLCWIPRRSDNSSGGQVWVQGNKWGPLQKQLLHFSFGQSSMYLVLRETVNGTTQGGTVAFPLAFDSGVMRGRFHPRDGQLYVSGLKGWVSNAVHDGCFERVRYTGNPVHLPVGVRTLQNGIALSFANALDRQTAEDPGNYAIEQWNYRFSQNYGSADYSLRDPRREGHDPVEVVSATLLDDGRTVFLELPDIQPVMQMQIRYQINSAVGARIEQTYVHTIHHLQNEQLPAAQLTRRARPGTLPPAIAKQLQPGVLWKFQQQHSDGIRHDARRDRLPALFVPPTTAPTPFLEAQPFTAVATGYIQTPLRGQYEFSLQGFGAARLVINGKPLISGTGDLAQLASASVELHKGFNAFELHYTSPVSKTAQLRLLWQSDAFGDEPVPPGVLYCRGDDPQLIASDQLRLGRGLFKKHHCVQCHQLPKPAGLATPPTTEFIPQAPDLTTVGRRINPNWLTSWILQPHQLRNDTTMPQLFNDPLNAINRQQAADIAAYVIARSKNSSTTTSPLPAQSIIPLPPQTPATAENTADQPATSAPQSGRDLYEDLGCIACHRFTAPTTKDEFERVSLFFVNAKYLPGALAKFLQYPHAGNRWSRMPNFHLTTEQATRLADYLRKQGTGQLPASSQNLPGDAQRGETFFRERGCVNCHPSSQTRSPSKPTERIELREFPRALAKGCLADTMSLPQHVPKYSFDETSRSALLAFLQTDGLSASRQIPAEAAATAFIRLRCHACHDRDQERSNRPLIVVEEGHRGLAPEVLPNLTWAGEKLHANWTAQFLGGRNQQKPRYWLNAKMPSFPAYARLLATGLALQHGVDPGLRADSDHHNPHHKLHDRLSDKRSLAEIGQQLTLKSALDCRQCHGVGSQLPNGDDKTKIALGINFALTRTRLRYDYYRRFVLDPPRYDIGSKMPKLSADGKNTKITDILNGNARQQFDAIWQYIQTVD